MYNIKTRKTNLREKYRKIREKLNLKLKEIMDGKILKKLLILKKYKEASKVLVYISKDIEVNTQKIIDRCLKDGKQVAAPVCNKETKTMKFYFINSAKDLEKGTFGILEPIVSKCEEVTDFSDSICIVPGFSFDRFGYRLGYGHGYYDRFLGEFNGTTIGLCYSNCISHQLPRGRFDKPVDILITNLYIKEINHK